MADRGELDSEEAEELFDRLGVKLSLTTTATLCLMGGPNYTQLGNWVHAGRAYVRAEANHANGANDLLVGHSGLER